MAIPTDAQIKKEIETLKAMKPKVRRYSMFNDDHHAAIDAQIEVLENDLDLEAIDEQFEGEVHTNAQDARSWLDGEHEEPTLSGEWQGLVKE